MPKQNPESWEEKLLNIEGFRKKLNGEEVSTVILLIRSLLLQAKQEEREKNRLFYIETIQNLRFREIKAANENLELYQARRHGFNQAKEQILKAGLLSLKEQGNPQKS